MMILKTERLVLRPLKDADAAVLCEAKSASWPELQRWMPWAKGDGPVLKEEEQFIGLCAQAWSAGDEFVYDIFLHDGTFLGCVTLFVRKPKVPAYELGYWMRTDYTRQGYAREAVCAVTDHAFCELKAFRVFVRCDDNNRPSRALPMALGFALEGVLRHDSRTPDGALRDTCVFAHVPDSWSAFLGKTV